MLPNFLGIGAAKSATTWLAKCLDEHPDIYIAPQKEVNILHYDSFDGDLSGYKEHFSKWQGQKAVGEVSVRYLDSHNAPARVEEFLPNAKIFVSLRNPIEQAYSHYWHLKRQNFHQANGSLVPETFEDAVEEFPDMLITPAMYAMHLKTWLQYVDPARLHIIFFEDIETHATETISRLYRFLEVDGNFTPPSIQVRDSSVRKGTSPRSKTSEKVGSMAYQTVAKGIYGQLKKAIGVRRAARLKDRLKARQLMELLFQKKGYPELSQPQRRAMIKLFQNDISELELLSGRNLNHWAQV